MIENYRSGFLWRLMRCCPYIIDGLRRAGFAGGWLLVSKPCRSFFCGHWSLGFELATFEVQSRRKSKAFSEFRATIVRLLACPLSTILSAGHSIFT